MNPNIPLRLKLLARAASSLFCLVLALGAHGASLTWDADTGTAGAQDGSGTWTTGAGGWWDGAANVNWAASDIATFGGGSDLTNSITVGGAITCGTPLTFNNSGYTLSAASARVITIGGTVAVAAGKSATIGTNVELNRSGGAWTLNGPGTLNISGPGSKVGTAAATASTVGGGATVNVLNGGTLSCGISIQVSGASGGAKLNVDGGTVTVGGTGGNFIINSSGASSSATVTLSNGGSISTASTTTAGLRFGGTGGWAVLNLDGGTMTTGRVFENNVAVLSTNNFNGGTLKAVSGTANGATFMTGLDRANVRNGGAVFDPNGQSITIGQDLLHSDISGDNAIDGGLTVVGTGGTVILTGANTYTGPTTITGSNKLAIIPPYNTVGSAVVVSNGGRLKATANTSSSVLPAITLNDGGGLEFDLGVYNPANVAAITNASLIVSGTNVINIAGGSIPVTNITLLAYTNKTGTSTFVLGTLPPGVAGTVTDTGSSLVLNVTSPSGNVYIWSAGTGDWDFVTANWNSGASVYSELATALVSFPASAVGTVNITTNVNPYSMDVTANAAGYNFGGAGSISGATGLAKSGTSYISLLSSNSYSGVTTISAGSIVAGADSALGSPAGATTVALGTALALSGGVSYSTAEPLTITGPGVTGGHFFVGSGTQRGSLQSISGNSTWAGNITITPDSNNRIGVQDGAALTLAGNITQSTSNLNLIFRLGNTAGSDIIVSGTSNNWSGSTSIYGGGGAALRLGTNNALPQASLLVVGIGGIGGDTIFDLNGFNQEVAGIEGDGVVGIIENNGGVAATLTLNPSPDHLYPGVIRDGSSSVGLTKIGAFTQILSGSSTYTGATTINGGSLRILGSIGATPVAVNTNAYLDGTGTIGGPVTINSGGTLIAGGGSIGTLTINSDVTIAGNLVFKVDKSLAQSNDLVNVSGVLTNTGVGTVTVANVATNELEVGDYFKLFSQAVGNGGALTIVAPAGVTFTNNLALDGSISVLSLGVPVTVPTAPTNLIYSVAGGQINLSWPSNYVGWILQTQTNALNTGLGSNWVDVSGSAVIYQTNFPIAGTPPTVFFRLARTNQP